MGDTAQGDCPTCPNGKCPKIDTTPNYPEPPAYLIEAAMRAVPDGLSGITPNNCDGRREVLAAGLVNWLYRRGHLIAAGAWAIHRLVTEGKLTAHRIPISRAEIFVGGDGDTCYQSNPRPENVSPDNKSPVSFFEISVRAEPLMWECWHPVAPENSTESKPPTPERGRPGRPKTDETTVERDNKIAADWKQARDSKVYKPDFAKEKGMTAKELDALLDRVRHRKARSDK